MNDETCTISSANPFADDGRPDAEERFARARLLCYIVAQIQQRGLSEAQAASLLDATPRDINLLLEAKMSNFSLERLLQMVARLGLDVSISFQPAASEYGRLIVSSLQPV